MCLHIISVCCAALAVICWSVRRIIEILLFPSTGRKWREKNTLGGSGKWQVEVGEPISPLLGALESDLIKESSSNVCKDLQAPLHLKLPILMLTVEVKSADNLRDSFNACSTQPQIIPKMQGLGRWDSVGALGIFSLLLVSLSSETILLCCWPTAVLASRNVG